MLVHVLLLACSLQLLASSEAAYSFTINIGSISTSVGCGFWDGACETYLAQFCLRRYESSRGSDCPLGRNNDDLERSGTRTMSSSASWPGRFQLYIEVLDEDFFVDDDLDDIYIDQTLAAGASLSFQQYRGSRGRVSIQASFSINCQSDYYGGDCSVFCQAQRSTESGFYTCNADDGSRVCLENYYGPNCIMFCRASSDPVNGFYTCNADDGSIVCNDGYRNPGTLCTESETTTSTQTSTSASPTSILPSSETPTSMIENTTPTSVASSSFSEFRTSMAENTTPTSMASSSSSEIPASTMKLTSDTSSSFSETTSTMKNTASTSTSEMFTSTMENTTPTSVTSSPSSEMPTPTMKSAIPISVPSTEFPLFPGDLTTQAFGTNTEMTIALSDGENSNKQTTTLGNDGFDAIKSDEKAGGTAGAVAGGVVGGVVLIILLTIVSSVVIVLIRKKAGSKKLEETNEGIGYHNAAYESAHCNVGSGPIPYSVFSRAAEELCSYEEISQSLNENIYMVPGRDESTLYAQLSQIVTSPDEVTRHSVKLGDRLGSGQFGIVYKGTWCSALRGEVEVAVKTLKEGSGEEDKVKFLQEAAIMAQFKHPNVVEMYGVVTQGEPILIVLEILKYGNLREYMLSKKTNEINDRTLLKYCRQVASGMAYLSSKAFVHRDLAARNILVSEEDVCKIADFGMSRDLTDETYYISRGGQIPVKWTAPEALHYKKYSTASDVWSYGALMYEIWSVGHKPFEDLTNNKVLKLVDTGYRLPPPPGCPRALYAIMMSCWHPVAASRPNFANVNNQLSASDVELLQWTLEDRSTHPEADKLGAALLSAQELYLDLQMLYKQDSANSTTM